MDENLLKCDCSDGSVVNGLRKPLLDIFVPDKPPGNKVFCQPETVLYEKLNKSVLNTKTFSLEVDSHKEVNFNVEALTFTLQSAKI